MPKLTAEEITDRGVAFGGEVMPNGESRFRLTHSDGSAYIRTEAGQEGAWQNAHHHRGVRETYIVQLGWMAFATEMGNCREVKFYFPGQVVSSQCHEDHNVYLPKGAVIHTVKHGQAIGNPEKGGADWYDANPEFASWTQSLTIDDLNAICREDIGMSLQV